MYQHASGTDKSYPRSSASCYIFTNNFKNHMALKYNSGLVNLCNINGWTYINNDNQYYSWTPFKAGKKQSYISTGKVSRFLQGTISCNSRLIWILCVVGLHFGFASHQMCVLIISLWVFLFLRKWFVQMIYNLFPILTMLCQWHGYAYIML